MGFKDEWNAADPNNADDLVQEIVDEMMDVIRDDKTHAGLKIRAAEILLAHFKKNPGDLPDNLKDASVEDMSELQLLKFIKERTRSAKRN